MPSTSSSPTGHGSARLAVTLLTLGLLLGCGGASSTPLVPITAPPLAVDLGIVSSTVSSTTPAGFENPRDDTASVTLVSTSGPFSLAAGLLPAEVEGGGTLVLPVRLDLPSAGTLEGLWTLRFQSPGGTTTATYELTAAGEAIHWQILPTLLQFGEVDVGQTLDLMVEVTNPSTLSPATLLTASVPDDYLLLGAPLPLALEPGESDVLTVRFAPSDAETHNGEVVLGAGQPGGPLTIPVFGGPQAGGGETITDFGVVGLDTAGRTPVLEVVVPPDAISLSLEGVMSAPSATIGLHSLTGPGGKVYETSGGSGDYIWAWGYEGVFATTVPNTDRTNVQLVPGGGTYTFRLRRGGGFGSTMAVRAIVERRPGGVTPVGRLDLNVWLADVIQPTADDAGSDPRLQGILDRIDVILGQQGISLGEITYYDIDDPTYDDVSESEFPDMLKLTSAAADVRLNLFFVRTAIGGGIVGVASAVNGPKRNGTGASGVMSVYDGYSTALVGLIAAHELGHYLGLYHTQESPQFGGGHDFIDDTPDCGIAGECTETGGGLLMHWQALGGILVSNGQGLVLRGHPCMGPPDPSEISVSSLSVREPLFVPVESLGSPDCWCGTCRAGAERRKDR